MDNQPPNPNAYDRSGRYEAGLASLVKSLKWAFGLLLVAIVGMLIYFFTLLPRGTLYENERSCRRR